MCITRLDPFQKVLTLTPLVPYADGRVATIKVFVVEPVSSGYKKGGNLQVPAFFVGGQKVLTLTLLVLLVM